MKFHGVSSQCVDVFVCFSYGPIPETSGLGVEMHFGVYVMSQPNEYMELSDGYRCSGLLVVRDALGLRFFNDAVDGDVWKHNMQRFNRQWANYCGIIHLGKQTTNALNKVAAVMDLDLQRKPTVNGMRDCNVTLTE